MNKKKVVNKKRIVVINEKWHNDQKIVNFLKEELRKANMKIRKIEDEVKNLIKNK